MSLTQAEAMARSALIAVGRYDIEIDLTAIPVGPDVRCISTTTFSCRHPGETTFVDCAADVVTATLNGAELGPAIDGRITLPELAAQNVLRVETVQGNTAEGEGVHKAVDPADGAVYLWTSFEPDEARHVWACFDQPDLKAPHTFVVTAPAEWTVVSNSGDPIVETIDAARRWTFPPTPPLSVYNTVVNAGPFHEIRRTAGGYDLGIFARRSLAVVLERDADEIFTLTEQFLGFFADVFGMPFHNASTTRCSSPRWAAPWRTTAASPGRTPTCGAARQRPPNASCSPWSCCTRRLTCGSATSSRCAGGTTSG